MKKLLLFPIVLLLMVSFTISASAADDITGTYHEKVYAT